MLHSRVSPGARTMGPLVAEVDSRIWKALVKVVQLLLWSGLFEWSSKTGHTMDPVVAPEGMRPP
jgi:hypothetical protein